MKTTTFWIRVFVLSLIVGICVRFSYGLISNIWGDEAISYFIAKNTSYHNLFFSAGNYYDFVHPPFYYIYLKACLLLGESDWWLRLTSLAWFFPSLVLVFSIGEKIKDKKTGLVAVSLFSLHPLMNNLGFQVRSYAAVIFFMLLVIYLLFRQLEKNNLPNQLLTGFILAISFYIDYASIWLIGSIFCFGICLLISKKISEFMGVLKTLIFFAIFSLFQITILGKILFSEQNKVIPGSVAFINTGWVLTETNLIIGFGITILSIIIPIVLSFILLKEKNNKINQFLVITLFSSLFFSILYSRFSIPIFLARNLVIASIAFIFIAAQFHIDKNKAPLVMVILLIYGFQSANHYRFSYQKQVKINIRQKVSNKDLILYFPGNEMTDHVKYYLIQEKKEAKLINVFDEKLFKKQNLQKNNKIFFINGCENSEESDCEKYTKEIEPWLCPQDRCETFF